MKEEIRLQKLMAMCGVASRRACEKLIEEGKVTVNGKVVTELGSKASLDDEIRVDGQLIIKEDKVYYALYKPTGYLTTVKDELGRRTVMDLMTTEAKKNRIFPIGRLDYDTSGILLLTNDGELSNRLINSANNIEKQYYCRVKGHVSLDDVVKLKKGVLLDGILTKSAEVFIKEYDKKYGTTLVDITITEGRNRQVRRMFESLGFEVKKLRRVRFGCVSTDGLVKGEFRPLKPHEVKKLYSL